MTSKDRLSFAESLLLLGEVHQTSEISRELAATYFDALKDFDLEDVQQALRQSVRESQWFPKPVELRLMITKNFDRQYQLRIQAWNDAKRAEIEDDEG
jgi:hypothetical protein